MRPNARALAVASSKERSAHLAAKCSSTGARKGLFAKSPFRHEIAIELGFAVPTGGNFCSWPIATYLRRVTRPGLWVHGLTLLWQIFQFEEPIRIPESIFQ